MPKSKSVQIKATEQKSHMQADRRGGQEEKQLEQNNQKQQLEDGKEKIKGFKGVKAYTRMPDNVREQCKGLIALLDANIHEVGEVSHCDVILAFCPVVSWLGTDIQRTLKDIPATKPCILVVMHFTTNPNYKMPDSKTLAREGNLDIVDCLFNEDKGLLKCSTNDEAVEKILEILEKHVKDCKDEIVKDCKVTDNPRKSTKKPKSLHKPLKKQVMLEGKRGVKVYYKPVPGNVKKLCQSLIASLDAKIMEVHEVSSPAECDVILAFCPVVSRLELDVETALKDCKDTKPVILVVMHFTINPNDKVQNSSKFARDEGMEVLDCLFSEDEGLVNCSKNDEAVDKILDILDEHAKVPKSDKGSNKDLKFYMWRNKDLKDCYTSLRHMVRSVSNKIKPTDVDTVEQSDIVICTSKPTQADIDAALMNIPGQKPCILVVIHFTIPKTEEHSSNIAAATKKPNVSVVQCAFDDEEKGFLTCTFNDKAFKKLDIIMSNV